MRNTFERAWDRIKSYFDRLLGQFETSARNGWEAVRRTIESIVGQLVTWFESTWDGVLSFLTGLFGDLETLAFNAWSQIEMLIMDPVNAIWDGIQEIWQAIEGFLERVFGRIEDTTGEAWAAIVGVVMGAWDGIVGFFTGIFEGVVETIGGLIDGVIGRVTDAWERVTGLVDGARGAIDDALEGARGVRDSLNAAAESWAPDWMQRLPGVGGGQENNFALGGVVTSPMRALVGDAGPEAIIPLDRLERLLDTHGGGGDMTVILELDSREVARVVAPRMMDQVRLRTGLSGG